MPLSRNLNFLEHFGPIQACNGTDLPSCAEWWVGQEAHIGGVRYVYRIVAGKPEAKGAISVRGRLGLMKQGLGVLS